MTQSSASKQLTAPPGSPPYVHAVQLALTTVPARIRGVERVSPGLIELCSDPRFTLRHISHRGVTHAEVTLRNIARYPEQRTEALAVNYDMVATIGSNDPLTVAPSLLMLSALRELAPYARDAIGILGLALQCSEDPTQLVMTRAQYEFWFATRADNFNEPPTLRFTKQE